ncbi:TetR/AcrR family transcriptional regulator [Inconstantimicrobium porci]|uniref:TetR/AcrR family transcriptional regulator n=1 Tax=Inconstantimicrobium porci TaxID=2652291 RepID=A0A7X2MZH7_9CLOT|nr:TetR/AcrR family transcriptional regulator [Inconstantimicrobium porci]MSR91460.1 TetR/AcrR family transcriptional regulator [Inconstantimicrobium porci]
MITKKYFDSTKEKYIAMIFKIFLEEGYDNATLSLIIKKLGISKGVFYHYFKNKEECAKQCAKYYTEMCIDNNHLEQLYPYVAAWIVFLLIKNLSI